MREQAADRLKDARRRRARKHDSAMMSFRARCGKIHCHSGTSQLLHRGDANLPIRKSTSSRQFVDRNARRCLDRETIAVDGEAGACSKLKRRRDAGADDILRLTGISRGIARIIAGG